MISSGSFLNFYRPYSYLASPRFFDLVFTLALVFWCSTYRYVYGIRGSSSVCLYFWELIEFSFSFLSSPISPTGSDCVAEVIITVFQRLCEELESKELNLLWGCFHEEIKECITNGCSMHLTRLLFLLVSTMQTDNGPKISGMLIQLFY